MARSGSQWNVMERDRLFLVEGDMEAGRRLSRQLSSSKWRVAWAASEREALLILEDAAFIELGLDALLINYELPDATASRVVKQFRAEWPWAPVAMYCDTDDIALRSFARTHRINLLRQPVTSRDLDVWLFQTRVPA